MDVLGSLVSWIRDIVCYERKKNLLGRLFFEIPFTSRPVFPFLRNIYKNTHTHSLPPYLLESSKMPPPCNVEPSPCNLAFLLILYLVLGMHMDQKVARQDEDKDKDKIECTSGKQQSNSETEWARCVQDKNNEKDKDKGGIPLVVMGAGVGVGGESESASLCTRKNGL
jgi:hypothetical protein